MAKELKQKKIIIFYQIIGIGLLSLAAFLFIIINLYPKLNLMARSFLNKLEVICGCTNHLYFTSHPFIFTSLILVSLTLVAFFGYIIIRVLKIKFSTSKFIKTALKSKKPRISFKLRKAAKSINLGNKIIEINGGKPLIFCFGFWHPKICISSKLVQKLNREELIVTLLHEKYHLISLEPLKIFIIKAITAVLFFLPVLKSLTKQYLALAEITADEQATNNWQNKIPLARALYKAIKLQEQSIRENNLAISFFSITNERINKLIDNKYIPRLKLSPIKLLTSILFVFLSITSFSLLNYYSQSVAVHQGEFCSIMPQSATHQCQMLNEKAGCLMSYELEFSSCEYK